MSCQHKFIKDLQLEYVDWDVSTLFIGTFNPGWNECPNNYAEWFYGRTKRNDFWGILPIIHKNQSLLNESRDVWIEFCRRNNIGITDILENIIDADPQIEEHRNIICGFKDQALEKFNVRINNVSTILEKHKNIKQICITRQRPLPDFWEKCFFDLNRYIKDNPQRQLEIKYLRSPSRGAIKGVVGKFSNFIANRWLEQGYKPRPS